MVETQATKVLHLCSENSIFKTLNTLMQLNAEKFAKSRNVRNYVYFDVHISDNVGKCRNLVKTLIKNQHFSNKIQKINQNHLKTWVQSPV